MRHEMKYVIFYNDYLIYKHRLDQVLKRDGHCKEAPYTITSLYYDDVYDRAYIEKIEGHAIRHKYRLRYYDDITDVKLERKSKIHQMTQKVSYRMNGHEDSELLNEFQFLTKHDILRPTSLVRYERMAYIHTVGDLRVTFDLNVRGSSKHLDLETNDHLLSSLLNHNEVIMEVKFNGVLPDFIASLLESGHQMALSSSKYVYSRVPMYL